MAGEYETIITAVYQLDAICVSVGTNDTSVLGYLDHFYRRARVGRLPHARIRAVLSSAPTGLDADTFGVGYRVDGCNDPWEMEIHCERLEALQIAARKAVRERWLVWLEEQGYAMFHASAVYRERDSTLLVFAGKAGAGKTTLALDAVLRHGFGFVSNDHLIVYRNSENDTLTLTSLPTPIPVRVGTFLALEHLLPEPWDSGTVDLGAYRALPAGQVQRLDAHVHYLLSSFGQVDPVKVICGTDTAVRVYVLFPAFAVPGQSTKSGPQLVADTDVGAVELSRHLRVAWAYGPDSNGQHGPAPRRSPARFIEDGQELARQLCACGPVLSWHHEGVLEPLLAHLGTARVAA